MTIKNIDLALKARRKPKSKKAPQSGRALGAGVEGRPEAAGAREESGHWEIGSAAGKKSDKSAVPAIVERKARSQIAAEPGERGSGAADADAWEIAGSFGEAAGEAFKSAAAGWSKNLPRKILGCRTPAEMFEKEILKIAQRAAPSPPPDPKPASSAASAGLGSGGPCSYVFHLGKGKTSLWHLLQLILQFILILPL
jgi:hypothetical protein